jgi:NAD(P)-dependent dehydrogenase (short-subunit alcohol dehydrogenase family)
LGSSGWHIVLACRNEEAGRQVAAEIAAAGGGRATVMSLDVSDPGSVRRFAAAMQAHGSPVHLLINNAGAIFSERRTDSSGVELTFATNVLGYHRVTDALLPLLRQSPGARIVNVASTYAFGLDLDDLQFERRPYDAMAAYAQSKACTRLLTYALARRVGDDGITCNAVAPGLMLDTDLYRRLPPEVRTQLEQYDGRTIQEGADTPLWLATSPELDQVTGEFFEQRTRVACEFRDTETEERLWRACETRSDSALRAGGAR